MKESTRLLKKLRMPKERTHYTELRKTSCTQWLTRWHLIMPVFRTIHHVRKRRLRISCRKWDSEIKVYGLFTIREALHLLTHSSELNILFRVLTQQTSHITRLIIMTIHLYMRTLMRLSLHHLWMNKKC